MFQTLLLDSNQLLQGRREVQTTGLEQIILNLVVWGYHVLDRIDDVVECILAYNFCSASESPLQSSIIAASINWYATSRSSKIFFTQPNVMCNSQPPNQERASPSSSGLPSQLPY